MKDSPKATLKVVLLQAQEARWDTPQSYHSTDIPDATGALLAPGLPWRAEGKVV